VSNARLVSSTGNSFVYRSLSEATDVSYSNGVIEVGSYDIVLADDYTIFLVEDNDATEITTSRLNRDYSSITGTVYAYLNDDDEATEVYVAVGTVYDEDGNDGKVETDYTFSTFRVAVDNSTGELSFTTACSAISSWTLGDPTIEYTIYRNGEEFGTYTQT